MTRPRRDTPGVGERSDDLRYAVAQGVAEMGLVANTTLVPSTERFELWSDVLNTEFGPSAVKSARARSFSGLLWRYELGSLCVHRVVGDASIYRRPFKRRGCDPFVAFQLVLARRGCCIVSQNGANSYIREGELTSYTTWQPLKVESPTAFELVIVTLPELLVRPLFARRIPQTALCLGGTDGIARLVRSHVLQVLRCLEQGSIGSVVATDVAESTVDLVRGLHGKQDLRTLTESRPSSVLRQQIHTYIDLHLGEPDLNRESIAKHHSISVSYLDKLFEPTGSSVWQTIRTQRLDRCRRDLADTRLAGVRILDIAARWGFRTASNFTRSFEAAYGASPAAFRRESRGLPGDEADS
jgi:AraC-like DNA-binding protein